MVGVRSSGWVLMVSVVALACGRTAKSNAPGIDASAGSAGAAGAAPSVSEPNCAVEVAGYGTRHCGVYEDGSVWCWGISIDGGTDDGWANEPRQIDGITDAVRIVLGDTHSCAITTAGKLLCWGTNDARQIDDSGDELVAYPAAVVDFPSPVRAVGLSRTQTCVLDILSHVYCRGAGGGLRQVEVELPFDIPGPGPLLFDVAGRVVDLEPELSARLAQLGIDNRALSTPGTPSCLVKRAGSAWCTDYQLDTDDPFRVRVALGESVLQAGTGDLFMCALTNADAVWCEGLNNSGQLGRGGISTFESGGLVTGLEGARRLSVAQRSTCSLRVDGSVWCWGAYRFQEPGVPAPTLVSACVGQQRPVPVLDLAAPRSSAARWAAAAQAQAQAVCECTFGAPAPQTCIEEENFAPNEACLEALSPADADWSCEAERHWQVARCFSSEACGTGNLPASCISPEPGCSPDPALRAIVGHCARRGCVLPQAGVTKAQLCDGTVDCEDGSDERNCAAAQTSFDCGGNQTIPISGLCDGVVDCANRADESGC